MESTKEMRKNRITLKIKKAEVGSLKKYAELMTEEHHKSFIAKYGNIIKLLDVDVQVDALSALAQFYDPPMRCFTFRDFQMAPTLEEYSQILGYSQHEINWKPPYKCLKDNFSKKDLLAVLKIEERELERKRKNCSGFEGFPQQYLEQRMAYLAEIKDWVSFMDVLALTIYGIVLFPRITEYVDMAAIDVFMAFKKGKENPVPAVLADTYCALTYCHTKKGKILKCSLHALYVWLVAHVFKRSGSCKAQCPIEDFKMCDDVKKMSNRGAWAQHLANLNEETIRWYPQWQEICEVIYQCGTFQNVPLIGTKGCIDYNPLFGLRQLGYSIINQPPDEETMAPFVVYENEMIGSRELRRSRQAWDRVYKKSRELGKRSCNAGVEYRKWLKERVQKNKLPFISNLELIDEEEKPQIPASDHGNEEEIEELKSKLLKAEEEKMKLQEELEATRRAYAEKETSFERSIKMAKIE